MITSSSLEGKNFHLSLSRRFWTPQSKIIAMHLQNSTSLLTPWRGIKPHPSAIIIEHSCVRQYTEAFTFVQISFFMEFKKWKELEFKQFSFLFTYSFWPRATSGPSNYFSASSSAIPQFPISNWNTISKLEFNFKIGIQLPNRNSISKLEFYFQIGIQLPNWNLIF